MNAIRTNRLLAATAVLAFTAAVYSAPTYALSDSTVSRADVKAQARAANKAGQLPAGEEDIANKQAPISVRSRADRKAETLAANRNGGLGSPGQSLYNGYNVASREFLARSTKTRAEGKAETLQAAKDHQLMPAGEVSEPLAR